MTSKSTRKLAQKTIQTTSLTANASPVAPSQAEASPVAPAHANASATSSVSGRSNVRDETSLPGDRMDNSTSTVRALQNELRLFRETLTADIKTQIEAMRGELRGDIAAFQQKAQDDMKTLRDELFSQVKTLADSHTESVNTQHETEKSLTDVGDRVSSLKTANEKLQKEYKKVAEKCMDLENRSRRQNIRIIGVEENIEKGNPTGFVAELLTQILGKDHFCSPLIIDRAHRTLGPKPRPGERPRALLARLHYYADKEKILRLSREKGQLSYNGSVVHIFPDMSPEVVRLRASFKQVKGKLRAAGIPYGLYYPARLEITVQGARRVFTDPHEAEKFLVGITPVDGEL